MNSFTIRAWWPWSYVDKSFRAFAAIYGWHLQEWSFRHCSTLRYGGRRKEKGARLQRCRCCRPWSPSIFSPPGLLLFPLPVLGLSAWRGDFRVAAGEGSWTPNSPMSSSKSVFFLLAAELHLFFLPVLLELSSLTELWFNVRWNKINVKNSAVLIKML